MANPTINDDFYSYDDSYAYDNMYSKYPTKDKKFVGKIRQFKGFFVKSPEFCNLEIPSMTDMTMYKAVAPTNSTQNSGVATYRALCDPGDIAFNGGARYILEEEVQVQQSEPVFDSTIQADVGWFAGLVESGPTFTAVGATVICLDNPPLRP
jgi:hypothetical protein